jgi:hypothetical protein
MSVLSGMYFSFFCNLATPRTYQSPLLEGKLFGTLYNIKYTLENEIFLH